MQTQPGAQSTELPLSRAEWELLVRLPRHVMLAAGHSAPGSTAPTPAPADAAIDAGRTAMSQLVRGIVAVIRSPDPPPASYTDRAVDKAGVLNECHVAAQLLHDRLPLADATAYEDW